MKKEGRKKLLPSLISILLLIVVAIASEVLYGMTKYLPLCMFALTCILPAALNVIVILLHLKFPEGTEPVTEGESAEEIALLTSDDAEEGAKKPSKRKRRKKKKDTKWKRFWRAVARGYNKNRVWIASVLALAATAAIQIRFFIVIPRLTSLYTMNYPILVGMVLIFTVSLVLDKWCLHAKTGDKFTDSLLKNLRSVLSILQFTLILMMIAAAFKLFNIYDTQTIAKYVLMIVFYYESLFLVLSFAVSVIKKQLLEEPTLFVPTPLAIGTSKELSLLTYFEENTGMTMRSLWSLRLIKTLIPYTIALTAVLLWFTTGLVQVEPHQTGIVYRFGKMTADVLEPGLHLCLPWPCDKVEIYDTESVKRFTVGYVSDDDDDNTWTDKHGLEEYQLLLGSRDELVSINLRVEYKIDDLQKYLSNNTSPENLVKAYAYQLVVDHTISNELETLLTIDREAFAEVFREELIAGVSKYETGLEIVSVVLESIHPPIDISQVYQDVISAEIEAERLIIEANGYYDEEIAKAETLRNTTVYTATINQLSKIASAQAEVSEFMASVGADGSYPGTYRYYKYLNAITQAYGNTKLVIVGDGIDSSNIYFGNLVVSGSTSSGSTDNSDDLSEEEFFE